MRTTWRIILNSLWKEKQTSTVYGRVLPAFVQLGRRVTATLLCALLIPLSQPDLQAQQSVPSPQPPGQNAAAVQPLTADQADQLVAPIALYPDSLIAQILASSTYPTEIVDADRWMQAHTHDTPQQVASKVNGQKWDPSVKALTAFPTVLTQLDKNLDWTTNLGNAYYNQPQDVMNAIQTMRHRAQASKNLASTTQQTVSTVNGSVVIAPTNPSVVYVPVYNPWVVYGAPLAVYPGFYYAPPPGIFFGAGIAVGFGVGIGIGLFAHWGWGWNNWRLGWHSRAVVFNHTTYITHSRTVINHGFNRPGGPGRFAGARGSYARQAMASRGATRGMTRVSAQHFGRSSAPRGGFGASRSSGGGHRGGGGRR